MGKSRLIIAVTLAVILVVGCGRRNSQLTDAVVEDTSTKLGEVSEIDLSDWLKKSRPALAELANEWSTTLERQLATIRQNPESVDLLPKFLPPQRVPGFHVAGYNKEAQLSLPPYLAAGQRDSAVALHLARYGDQEAARRFASPDDAELLQQIESFKTPQAFPIEWTRAVALAIYSAQYKLATGDVDGATEIVFMHQQLKTLLEPKSAPEPLRAALLPLGKLALTEAVQAFRKPQKNKTALADQIEQALAEWGDVPIAQPSLSNGDERKKVTALFGSGLRGKAVLANTPTGIARFLDLLDMPIAHDGAASAVAFLDEKECLACMQICYRSRIDTLFPQPNKMVYSWLEAGASAGPLPQGGALMEQRFEGGSTRLDIQRTNRSPQLGALIRIGSTEEKTTAAVVHSLRDFGPVHLDRTFETCRLGLAPAQAITSPFKTTASEAMELVGKNLTTRPPAALTLYRLGTSDLLSAIELEWAKNDNTAVLTDLLPSLWADFGPAVLESIESPNGSYMAFRWKDKNTQVDLRLSYKEAPPQLVASDTQSESSTESRLATARQLEQQERLARLEANKPSNRLVRSPVVGNDSSLAGLQLGQSKADALAALPASSKTVRRTEFPGGISVTFLDAPPKVAPYWLRQLLVRLDHTQRVSEIRLRYVPGLKQPKEGPVLAKRITDAKSGVPEIINACWQGLWGSSKTYRWRDDQTIRLLREDPWGMELVLWDRPADSDALMPPPWQFLPTGVHGVHLGMSREQLIKALKEPAAQSGSADVFRMPAKSPYEMALVWFEKDQAVRFQLVHRERPKEDGKDTSAQLARAWGLLADSLGYIRRQEGASGANIGAYNWHDDRVAIRISVQTTEHGPRVFTEWRYWAKNDSKDPVKGTIASR